MDKLLTPYNIMFVIFLIGTVIGVYNHFKKPQDESRINEVITKEQMGGKASLIGQTEVEQKASLLAQQVDIEKGYNTNKFIDVNQRFDKIDDKIETLIGTVNKMNLDLSTNLIRVETIVSEHMKVI